MADVEVGIVLEGDADQISDGILCYGWTSMLREFASGRVACHRVEELRGRLSAVASGTAAYE